jgi:hypothetical protein
MSRGKHLPSRSSFKKKHLLRKIQNGMIYLAKKLSCVLNTTIACLSKKMKPVYSR